MKPTFKETKTTQAASLLLQLADGSMNYMKLLKLLYIADRRSLLDAGRPITFDRYVALDHGPVPSQTYDLISDERRPEESSSWQSHISAPEGYDVSLESDPGQDKLSEAEIRILRTVYEELGYKNKWDVRDISHNLPEWKDPSGSAIPIRYKDILKQEKTEREVTEIEDELASLAEAEQILEFT